MKFRIRCIIQSGPKNVYTLYSSVSCKVCIHFFGAHCIVNCGLSGCTEFFPHYLINATIYRKEVTVTECVFSSSNKVPVKHTSF